MKIKIHPLAFFCLFVNSLIMPRAAFVAYVFSVLLHEAGHIAAAGFARKKPREIKILPVGISIGYDVCDSYKNIIFIASAGPFMNAAAALFTFILPLQYEFSVYMRLFSLSLALLNLLPVSFFDGGSIMHSLLAMKSGISAAENAARAADIFFLGAVWLAAVYIFFYSAVNASLLIFSSYVFAAAILKKDAAVTR